MSTYAEKIEKQLAEIKKEQKEKRKIEEGKRKKAENLASTKKEKSLLKRNFKRIDKIDEEQKEKDNAVIKTRRQLRKRYLRSLKVGDIKLIESASQSMLGYEIGLKLEKQEDERDF